MGFRTLAFTYVLGGLTFLPLLLAAVFASAWYLLPRVYDGDKSNEHEVLGEKESQDGGQDDLRKRSRRLDSFSDGGASGTFAVLRQYDFSSAIGALNARNNTGGNANVNADGSLIADGNSTGTSESVYQSMYRTVFAGNKNASSSSLLDSGDPQQNPVTRRKAVPANVMYIVLRHGHLMLYDSPSQVEVKHVISLAHHKITLQADKDGEPEGDERNITEADLFTKRTAIVLTPVELPNGARQKPNSQKTSRPFFLFCGTNIDKEDFYHALLATRTKPPVPRPMDSDALIKLQSSLHSSSLTPDTRALSALLGRVFLGIHKTDRMVDFVRGKIEKKLRKIQKPSFIPLLEIRSLNLGDAGPIISNLKLKDLNISGDTTISADVRYNGGLSLTLLAVAKLDLGPRFKARTVDLVVKTTVHRISGTMLFRVKPAPSNRIWFTFESMPDLDIRVEPVVSERKITYGFVLRAIEERVRSAFGEGLVKPNWDDTPMPMQDTRGSHARGGVWSDEGEEDHPPARKDAERIRQDRDEKTLSTPDLSDINTGKSTGLSSNSEINLTKLRHSSTMPVTERRNITGLKDSSETVVTPEKSPRPPKPLRSPSISAMSPSVAVDGKTVERADDASIRGSATPQARSLWRSRGSPSFQQTQKDALEELRDLRDRADQAVAKPSAVAINEAEKDPCSSDPVFGDDGDAVDSDSIRSRQHSDGSESTIAGTPRSFSLRSTDSDRSSATSLSSTLPRSQQLQQKKTNILAAAGAATNAARTWGWNAIQKNKGAFQRPGGKSDQPGQAPNEPMGRGQPLPPPGVPLPGPQKGMWGVVGTTRRKPVPALPPRRPRAEDPRIDQPSTGENTPQDPDNVQRPNRPQSPAEDEFGTWQENPGAAESENFDGEVPPNQRDDHDHGEEEQSRAANGHTQLSAADDEDLLDLEADQDEEPSLVQVRETQSKAKKAPPPLPRRRTEPPNEPEIQPAKSDHTPDGNNASHERPGAPVHNDSATTALQVPEDAADSIAAENSTAELALGIEDDKKHISEAEGVEAQIEGDTQPASHTSEEVKTHGRSDTQQRFVQGEDVTEDDFEKEPEQQNQTNTTDDLAERIKAQVQKHSAGEGGFYGGPKGTAVDEEI